MLPTSQANAVAEALIDAGKRERLQRLEASAARIPRVYRSAFPLGVPAWRQAQLFGEARRSAGSAWMGAALGACVLWLLADLVLASAAHLRVSEALLLAMPAFAGLVVLLRVALVKLRLQQMLLMELAAASTDGTPHAI